MVGIFMCPYPWDDQEDIPALNDHGFAVIPGTMVVIFSGPSFGSQTSTFELQGSMHLEWGRGGQSEAMRYQAWWIALDGAWRMDA